MGRRPTVLVVVLTVVGCSNGESTPAVSGGEPAPLIAIHLASPEQRDGWTPVSFDGRDLYLEPEPVVSDAGISGVAATRSDDGVVLGIRLTASGAERLHRVTAEHPGEPLAVMLDSRVVTAPVIRSEVTSGRIQLSVPASDEEAAGIVERARSRWPGGEP